MDIKLLLVKSITLLFQESQLSENINSSASLIKKAIDTAKLPESAASDGLERNAIVHLRTTVLWMIANHGTQAYDKNGLLQRLRVNVGDDDNLYDAFLQGLSDYPDDNARVKAIAGLKRNIQGFISREKAKDVLKKASHAAAFKENDIEDWTSFLSETAAALSSIDMGGDVEQDPAFVKSVDFSLRDSVVKAFQEMEDTLSEDGMIRLPWKALNRLCGGTGIRRGEHWMFPALPHNYKSGVLVDIFIGICLFNDPFLFDKDKKPAVILYSSEDDVPIIIQKIFVILKQRETGMPVKYKEFDNDYRTDYVMKELSSRGWNVFIHRVRPSMITYRKYTAHMEDYKSKGFEVCAVVCDYLGMFNREGCNNGAVGDDIQDLHRRVREYTSANKIAHITAHQLSTQAKEHSRMKPDDWIFDMPGKGFYQGCKKIDDELDGECYINKRIVANGAFLEFLWGKHRKVGSTAEKDKYFALKFLEHPMYGIQYDIDLEEDLSCKVVGGKSQAQGGGKEWFDMD